MVHSASGWLFSPKELAEKPAAVLEILPICSFSFFFFLFQTKLFDHGNPASPPSPQKKNPSRPSQYVSSPTLLLCQHSPILEKALIMQIFVWGLDSFPPISNSLWLWTEGLTLVGTGSQADHLSRHGREENSSFISLVGAGRRPKHIPAHTFPPRA